MIDVGKFAKPLMHKTDETFFRCGTNTHEKMAAELHKFANKISSGEILVEKVQGGQIASADGYFIQALFIEFLEKEVVEANLSPDTEEGKVKITSLDLPSGTMLTITVSAIWTDIQIQMFQEYLNELLAEKQIRCFVYPDKKRGFE